MIPDALWILLAVIGAAAASSWFLLKPSRGVERGASRGMIARGVISLMRLYEDGSLMSVRRSKSSRPLLHIRRFDVDDDGCDLVFECPGGPDDQYWEDTLLEEIRKQGFEPEVVEKSDGRRPQVAASIKARIADFWTRDARDYVVGFTDATLDAVGISRKDTFDLSFGGKRLQSRRLELLQRRTRGEDVDW